MGRDKGKKRNPRFVMVPHAMLKSEAWLSLSHPARTVWLHLAADFNGRNEGRLKLPYSQAAQLMTPRTFNKALKELRDKGFIVLTKQGGLFNTCSEYALSYEWRDWRPDEKKSQVAF